MRITRAGKSLVITSSIKVADLKRAALICPEALAVTEKHGEVEEIVFRADYSESKKNVGGISKMGVNFDTKTSEGFAQLTVQLEEALTKDQIADQYGMAFLRLKTLEESFAGKYSGASGLLSQAVESVEIVD